MQTLRQSDKCFCQCQFWWKKMSILCQKNIIFGLTFSLSMHYYRKWLSFCKICLFLKKCEFLCEGLYTLTKCQILIKNFNFLGYVNLFMCWFSLKYFICWKIVILIQNIILFNDTLGKSVIFLVKSTLHLV